jgi:hypothetical protein
MGRLVLPLACVACCTALDNGIGQTPWMGWSAWEVFRCTTCEQDPENCLSEKLIKETTDAMVSFGFRDAGYTIVWIDDCWSDKKARSPSGAIAEDKKRFPNGMKALADYVHSQNMSLGLYGDIGTATCEGQWRQLLWGEYLLHLDVFRRSGFPGLTPVQGLHGGGYDANAKQMAEWGIDAFKAQLFFGYMIDFERCH